jgi:hypothetical protein
MVWWRCTLSAILSGNILTFSSFPKGGFIGDYFFFGTVKISCHPLLACEFSPEKCVVRKTGTLTNVSFFPQL